MVSNLALKMKQRNKFDFVSIFYDSDLPEFQSRVTRFACHRHNSMKQYLTYLPSLSRGRRSPERYLTKPVLVQIKPTINRLDDRNWNAVFSVHQTWMDNSLRWTPKNFNDRKSVRLATSTLWKPQFSCSKLYCKVNT